MHLPQRGRGQRRPLDGSEAFVRELSKAREERLLHDPKGLRRHIVLQALQFPREGAREKAPQDTEHLP